VKTFDIFSTEAFKDVGQQLELLHREVHHVTEHRLDDRAVSEAKAGIDRLNALAYKLGVTMMVRVREERVGSAAPGAVGEAALTDARR